MTPASTSQYLPIVIAFLTTLNATKAIKAINKQFDQVCQEGESKVTLETLVSCYESTQRELEARRVALSLEEAAKKLLKKNLLPQAQSANVLRSTLSSDSGSLTNSSSDSSSSDSSSSDSSSSDSSSSDSSSSDSSTSSDSESEAEAAVPETPPVSKSNKGKKSLKAPMVVATSIPVIVSQTDIAPKRPAPQSDLKVKVKKSKKAKLVVGEEPAVPASAAAVIDTTAKEPSTEPATQVHSERFSRVVASEVTFLDPSLRDNRYESNSGSGYANKAHNDLIKTKGKGFRKEKDKKKRGSFHSGGPIDGKSHSFKFED